MPGQKESMAGADPNNILVSGQDLLLAPYPLLVPCPGDNILSIWG